MDQNLIHRIAEGDSSAFKELYDLYSERVYNISISYLKDTSDAEEITQDVFLKIHKSASIFKGESSAQTWIYRITVNACLNKLKANKRFSFIQLTGKENQVSFDHPGAVIENKEKARILFQVIDILPENQRTAFILSYIEELPRKEVAEIMEVSLKSVESLLQRAKKNLRVKLEKMFPERRKSEK